MTSVKVQWGRNPAVEVSTVQELDALLDEVAGQRGDGGAPFRVNIGEHLEIGVGYPERSFVFLAAPDGGWGGQPDVEPIEDELAFDHGGQWTQYYPESTRVTVETAREAAREYLRTGKAPTVVEFGDEYSPYD